MKHVIGITGMPLSGKSTVAEILKEKGFVVVKYSELKELEKHLATDIPLVVFCVKNINEIEHMKKHSRFTLVAVETPMEVRWERLKKKNLNLVSYDEFLLNDSRTKGVGQPIDGSQVGMCIVQADFIINNDEDFGGNKLKHSKLYKDVMAVHKKVTDQS